MLRFTIWDTSGRKSTGVITESLGNFLTGLASNHVLDKEEVSGVRLGKPDWHLDIDALYHVPPQIPFFIVKRKSMTKQNLKLR